MIPRSKSEIIFGSESPASKKVTKDPFRVLGENRLSKLMPVSPSGSRLPSLQNRPGTNRDIVVRDSGKKLPQFDLLFRHNRLKVTPKDLNKPKTPYFRIRRREEVGGKEVQTAKNKIAEFKFGDVSFGNA